MAGGGGIHAEMCLKKSKDPIEQFLYDTNVLLLFFRDALTFPKQRAFPRNFPKSHVRKRDKSRQRYPYLLPILSQNHFSSSSSVSHTFYAAEAPFSSSSTTVLPPPPLWRRGYWKLRQTRGGGGRGSACRVYARGKKKERRS